MKGKIFSRDEVSKMIPLVSRIAGDIVATYATVRVAYQALDAAKKLVEKGSGSEAELVARDKDVCCALDTLQRLVEEIEALGGTVRNFEAGAVDFYGELNDQIVYLCWKPGEPTIRYWHRLEEAPSTRRPISPSRVA